MMGSGDESAEERFQALYEAYGARVLAYCRRRAGSVEAEDAVAETFLVVWRRLDQVPEAPLPWLFVIAGNVLSNQMRSARRQGAVAERLARETRDVASVAFDRPVLEALGSLAKSDQEVLLLVAWDGLSSEEAARVLGCSGVAFRLRLHRARRKLANALQQQEGCRSGRRSGLSRDGRKEELT